MNLSLIIKKQNFLLFFLVPFVWSGRLTVSSLTLLSLTFSYLGFLSKVPSPDEGAYK